MTLTGKEIQSMTTTEGTGMISRKEGRACLEYTSPNGTKFQYTGPNSINSVACCNALLEALLEVGNECVILNEKEQQKEVYWLYMPLKAYWNLRRSVFAQQTAANRIINVNGYPCSLLDKDDYYSTDFMTTVEQTLQERSLAPMYAGVYGIYDGDDLLYVGSATCLIERWKEHNQNFRTKSFSSKLYSAEVDPDQLIYKELISGTEIAQTCGLASTSTWLLEFAEWMYIRILWPKYNIKGKTKQFQFHPNVKKSEELMSHLEDGRNEEKAIAQPRSTERTRQLRNLHNLPQLLIQMTYSHTVSLPQKKLLSSHPYHLTYQPSLIKNQLSCPLSASLICEHLAKQDKYTASIPANWLTKAQIKELVSRQYLIPDSAQSLRLNRNYLSKKQKNNMKGVSK